MTPGRLRTLCKVEWPACGSWLATRGHNGLEDNKSSLCDSHRKTWAPRPVPIHRLLARADPRSPTMGMTLYSKWRRKKAQKLTDDKKEILQDPNEELPRALYWMMNPPSNVSARGLNSHQAEATGHSSTTPVPGPSFSPPEVIELPPQQAPTPAGGTPGYRPPDSTLATEARHRLYPPPPPPVSPLKQGRGTLELNKDCAPLRS